jgi:hypothetical protein
MKAGSCTPLGRELALGQGQERRVVAAVVALAQVVDVEVAIDVARLVVPVADEPRLAEERRHGEELVAGAVGEVAVDVLEVQRAVVARDTRRVEAEEHSAHVDGQRVDVIETVGDAVVVHALDEPALELVAAADHRQRRNRGVHLGRRRQHVVHELVVGPIDLELLLEPVVEGIGAGAGLVRHPEQIAPVPRPLLGELVARQQRVDEPVTLVGAAIGDEGADVGGSGWQAGGVEVDAADELVVAAERGVRNAGRLQPAEDELVDEVTVRHRCRRRRGISRRGDGVGEPCRVAAAILAAAPQIFVGGFNPFVLGGCRRRRRLGLRPQRGAVDARGSGDERRRPADPHGHGPSGPGPRHAARRDRQCSPAGER